MKRTERGFAIFGKVVDSRGNTITVQESSDAGGIYAWLFSRNRHGETATVHHVTREPLAASPHLTRAQARKLAAILLRFADAESPAPGVWRRPRKGGAK